MIRRADHIRTVRRLLADNPVVAILGARQIGKTTLARQVASNWRGNRTFFDLEDDVDRRRLADPGLALRDLRGLVVLDEIQHLPEVFSLLRVLADRPRHPARFLVLGSASPTLLRQTAESLAGRVAFHDLGGLTIGELHRRPDHSLERLWWRGGFPASYLARTDARSQQWRRDFVRTFLTRDIPALDQRTPPGQLDRFWRMLAHWHGQILNVAELGRSLGVTDAAIRRYLDLLAQTFVVTVLRPWHENLGKRQVKSPKVYLADSGLLHTLLGIDSLDDLLGHPKVGASWEGFLMAQTIHRLGAQPDECFFWSTHQGAEVDLVVVRGRHRLGFEWKRAEAPGLTPSMRIAVDDLKLDSLTVVHGGRENWAMAERVRAVAARDLLGQIEPL